MTNPEFVKASVHMRTNLWADDIECAIVIRRVDGAASIMRVSLEEIDPSTMVDPTFAPHGSCGSVHDLIQSIVDEAWRTGIRPTVEGYDREAQRRHLEDMRSLVFARAKTEAPK